MATALVVLLGHTLTASCQSDPLLRSATGVSNSDAHAPSPPPDGETRKGVLRVATFNVHRYFDTNCDSAKCGGEEFEAIPSPAEFDAATLKLAKGIALLKPDVIALEEVENRACLDALVTKLKELDAPFSIAEIGETNGKGSVDVAILAKGNLPEVRKHRDLPLSRPDGSSTSFSRELLEVRMSFGSQQVVMFAAHFRSKVNDDPGRRIAEASAARTVIGAVASELPNALVLLGGDLNDTPGSETLVALEQGNLVVRVARDIPENKQGTFLYRGSDMPLDHIYVVSGQAKRYVAASATRYRDTGSGFAGSDHAALSAEFLLE